MGKFIKMPSGAALPQSASISNMLNDNGIMIQRKNHRKNLKKKLQDFDRNQKACIFAVSKPREHSSVGLEHLPYKQRVTGSTPVAPTSESLT